MKSSGHPMWTTVQFSSLSCDSAVMIPMSPKRCKKTWRLVFWTGSWAKQEGKITFWNYSHWGTWRKLEHVFMFFLGNRIRTKGLLPGSWCHPGRTTSQVHSRNDGNVAGPCWSCINSPWRKDSRCRGDIHRCGWSRGDWGFNHRMFPKVNFKFGSSLSKNSSKM